jgi:hypothetical protein
MIADQVSLVLRRSADPDRPLSEYRVDSLGALELRNRNTHHVHRLHRHHHSRFGAPALRKLALPAKAPDVRVSA